jgi:formylglycine-generating enzyme required for sulfatase activity
MRLLIAIAACTLLGLIAGHAQTGKAPLTAAQERALKPLDRFKECDKCPDMVVVPTGSFTIGSPESEPGRLDAMGGSDEGPLHKVTIGAPFAVGRFAVTFDEWDACVAEQGCDRYRPMGEEWSRLEAALLALANAEQEQRDKLWRGGRQPAIFISWDDAAAYVKWLSRKTGKTYRLLSEAEREYVTRAGTTTPFWWGASISPSQANYNAALPAYGGGARGENRARPLPVDSFQPNPWGLYQVHGNIWEWTADCYFSDYRNAPADGSARGCLPTVNERVRVMRGGSWVGAAANLRSASRYRNLQHYRSHDLGFRVARTL